MASYVMLLLFMLIPILIGLGYGLIVRSRAISLLFLALLAASALIFLAVWLAPVAGFLT